MEVSTEFTFRGRSYDCDMFIDSSEDPCYVFVELKDADLIRKFGAEVSIKTDFEKLLVAKDDYAELPHVVELKQAIFEMLLVSPEFIHTKLKIEALNLLKQFRMAGQASATHTLTSQK